MISEKLNYSKISLSASHWDIMSILFFINDSAAIIFSCLCYGLTKVMISTTKYCFQCYFLYILFTCISYIDNTNFALVIMIALQYFI